MIQNYNRITEQLRKSQEEFEKNKDLLMKQVENDIELLAWVGWGNEALFIDFSYDDMLVYMQNLNYAELKEKIKILPTEIRAVDVVGIKFDALICFIEKVITLCDLENQISYFENEINNRAFVYGCVEQFIQTNYYDKKHYRNCQKVISNWIFPKPAQKRKNTIERHQFPEEKSVFNLKRKRFELLPQVNRINKIDNYLFFLGNPNELPNEKNEKRLVLLELYDALFGFDLTPKQKIEKFGKMFNLQGKKIEEEIMSANDLLQGGLDLYEAFGGNKELLIELLDKAKEVEFYERELEQSKAENMKLKEQLAKLEAQKDKK